MSAVDAPAALLRAGGVASRLAELTGLVFRPVEREPVPAVSRSASVVLAPGRPFTVLSWNVQYAATRRQKFFYDGGEAVHVPAADRDHALDAIGAQLRDAAPDLVLMQELDRDSDRTGRLDQLGALLERAPFATFASASCHRSRFVPAPASDPLRRVDMHVAVLTRFQICNPTRIQLPLLREPRWRQAFNLKRCLLTAEIPVAGRARPLHVAVTHLSAFSRGDGTLARQVGVLHDWMAAREAAGESFVLGGDLNLLPPGDDPARLGQDSGQYADHPNPVERLIPRFRSVVPPEALLDPRHATYLPWGAVVADRVLDYLFVSDDIEIVGAGPVSRPNVVSDHHPMVATLRLR